MGRAADRRVAPASRARASCRWPTSRSAAPDVYGDDRVFVHLQRQGRRRASTTRRSTELARAGHPVFTLDVDGPRTSGADLLLRRVRDRGRRLGARDQPVRPAERAGGEGQHGQGARAVRRGGRAARGRGGHRRGAARAARRRGAAELRRDHGLRRSRRTQFDEAVAELRAAIRDATKAARRRSATGRASCTRPASSTRAARRPGASCSSSTTATRTSRSRRRATRSGRSRTRRRPATCRRCARTACPPSGCGSRAIPVEGVRDN